MIKSMACYTGVETDLPNALPLSASAAMPYRRRRSDSYPGLLIFHFFVASPH